MVKPEESHLITAFLSGSKVVSIASEKNDSFRRWKAVSCSSFYWKGVSFLVSRTRGSESVAKSLINFL
jgi:hypothetical protein